MTAWGVAVSDIIENARSYADMGGSDFVSDLEAVAFVYAAYREYWNLVIARNQDYILTTSDPIAFVPNQVDYTLPDNFRNIRGVDVSQNSDISPTSRWFDIEPFNFSERNLYKNNQIYFYTVFGNNIHYSVRNNTLTFQPYPSNMNYFRYHYTPRPPVLTSDTSVTLEGYANFDDYISLLVAERMRAKEESDISYIRMKLNEVKADLITALSDRNRDKTSKVVATRSRNWYW
jgi:hypothetical protein